MIGFLGESIKNRFPYWSKIRSDASSYGASLLDIIGDSLEEIRISTIRGKEQRKAFSEEPIFENSHIQLISLLDDAAFNNSEQLNVSESNISVSADGVGLSRIFFLEDLAKHPVTRLQLVEDKQFINLVYEGNSFSNTKMYFGEKGSHLFITIDGEGVFEREDSKAFFDENYYIVIRGEDITGRDIEEYIQVTDEKEYRTFNRFKRIKPVTKNLVENIQGGPSIEPIGFISDFKVTKLPFLSESKEIECLLSMEGAKTSVEEGFINDNKLLVKIETVNGNKVLNYYLVPFSEAKFYRTEDSGSEKHFLVNTQRLVDFEENPINISDFCYDKVRNKIDVIDTSGVIYSFNIGKKVFERTGLFKTKRNNLEVEISNQRAYLGEEITLYVNNYKESLNINNVIIAREKPSARSEFNTFEERVTNLEFLQENKTWSSDSIYLWPSSIKLNDENPTNWNIVTTTTTVDEYGQWDFYAFEVNSELEVKAEQYNNGLISIEDLNVYLKADYRKDENEIFVCTSSMFCESNAAINRIDTELLVEENTVFGLHRDGNENLLYVFRQDSSGEKVFKYKEILDVFLFDRQNKIVGLKEKYNLVTIEYNGLVIEASYD